MGFFRWMFGLPLAAAITAGLFIFMAMLISRDADVAPPVEAPTFDFIFDKPPPERGELPKPPKIDPKKVPPPPVIDRDKSGKPGGGDYIEPPQPGPIDIDVPKGGGTTIQVPPPYPEACRSKGVEGAVLVRFDVTDRGETTNIVIISSPDRCFDRDVIRAVRGWRYPQEARRGVTASVNFVFAE
jgi:protein TonB